MLAPPGYDAERERALRAGLVYAEPVEQRALPDLPPEPGWRDLLERAWLANGDLEAAYFAWRAALERVEMAGGWPNTALMPSFSVMLSDGEATTWDSATVGLGFDASENLELPVKARARSEVALAEARSAGERFREARFALKRSVLDAWLELVLAQERARVASADAGLVRLAAATAAPRVRAGGPQAGLLRAEIEAREAETRALRAEGDVGAARAMLNGLLARAPEAPLATPAELPEPRPLPDDDGAILALGVHRNPHLASLVEQAAGRENALELARLAFLPNINPFFALTGDVAQTIGAAVMLPTDLPEIRGGIAEARALLSEVRASARQAHRGHEAHFVAALIALRSSEREAELLQRTVRSGAELLEDTLRAGYAAGSATFTDLIEAQRMLLDLRLAIAEVRVERERRAAEIEQLAGIDLEALPSSPEASRP